MIKIPEVTLIMLADLDIEDAVYAVNKSCEGIHWGAAKFLSSKGRPKGLNPNVNYEEVYPILGPARQNSETSAWPNGKLPFF